MKTEHIHKLHITTREALNIVAAQITHQIALAGGADVRGGSVILHPRAETYRRALMRRAATDMHRSGEAGNASQPLLTLASRLATYLDETPGAVALVLD